MTVAVVGLGKIGLPLSVAIATSGEPVVGFDVDEGIVATINGGAAPFPGEPDLEERLRAALQAGTFRATTDPDHSIPTADTVLVVVPLVVDDRGRPDFTALDGATHTIGGRLRPGALVSYETTLPVGTTRRRFAPRLAETSGFTLGEDLFVCHSPERVSSGRVFADLRRYPKLVGGIDPASEARAASFYAEVLEFDHRDDLPRPNGVWALGGAEAAELTKLAETTYRDLNIAFANELALAAEGIGIDIGGVIEAANSQPFSHIHQPGIWVGGHCIPMYPHLLMSTVPGLRLPSLAREVNEQMAQHAVESVDDAIGGLRGRTVAILGLAFRPGVKEDFCSGAYRLSDLFAEKGAVSSVHDPLYTATELGQRGLLPHELGAPCDAVVLHTAHPEYQRLDSPSLGSPRVIYDGRRVLDRRRFPDAQVLALGG